jgi:hypothetical protein
LNCVAAAVIEREMGVDIDIERKKELDREKVKEGEKEKEKEGEGLRKMEKEGELEGDGEMKRPAFSVACVLDAPLGALLLYYLPHSFVQEDGEEMVKGKGGEMVKEKEEVRVQVKEKEKERVKEIEKLNVKRRVSVTVEGIRGTEEVREEKGENESKHENVLPFCVIDLVWLLQLKDGDSTSDDNNNNNTNSNNMNVKSNSNAQNSTINLIKRLNSPNKSEFRKSKLNEKSANHHYNTTIKIKETVDRAFFLKNTLIVITKTISRKIQHQNDGISSIEVPVPNVEVDKMMTGKDDNRHLVEKKRRNSFDLKNQDNDGDGEDDNGGAYERKNVNFDSNNKEKFYKNRSSSSSGSWSGSEKGSARGSGRGGVSRSHIADNSDEMKVIGGTIYVLNFNGKR